MIHRLAMLDPSPLERALLWSIGSATTLASMLGGDSVTEVLIKGGIGGGLCIIAILLVRAGISAATESRADGRATHAELLKHLRDELAHEKRQNADLIERVRTLEDALRQRN